MKSSRKTARLLKNPGQFMPRGQTVDPALPRITRKFETLDWNNLMLKHNQDSSMEIEPFEMPMTANRPPRQDITPTKKNRFFTITKRGSETATNAKQQSSDSQSKTFDNTNYTFKKPIKSPRIFGSDPPKSPRAIQSDKIIEDLEFAKMQANLSTVKGLMDVMDAVAWSISQMVRQLKSIEQGNRLVKIMRIWSDSVSNFVASVEEDKKKNSSGETRAFKRDQYIQTDKRKDNLLSEEEERFIELELNRDNKFEKDYMEISDKLARLSRSTVTAAPELLNDIWQSMNSKVKHIPDYKTQIFHGVQIEEWETDMNEKMNRMQRETAKAIFNKYIIKEKSEQETQTGLRVVPEDDLLITQEHLKKAESRAVSSESDKEKIWFVLVEVQAEVKSLTVIKKRLEKEVGKSDRKFQNLKKREATMAIELGTLTKGFNEVNDNYKDSCITISDLKRKIIDAQIAWNKANTAVDEKDKKIQELLKKLKDTDSKDIGKPCQGMSRNSSYVSAEDTEELRQTFMGDLKSKRHSVISPAGSLKGLPSPLVSPKDHVPPSQSPTQLASPRLRDLDEEIPPTDNTKIKVSVHARKFSNMTNKKVLEQVDQEDEDIWQGEEIKAAPVSLRNPSHIGRSVSPPRKPPSEDNQSVASGTSSKDSPNVPRPVGSHRWITGPSETLGSPSPPPSEIAISPTPVEQSPEYQHLDESIRKRWSNRTRTVPQRKMEEQIISMPRRGTIEMPAPAVQTTQKPLHAKSSLLLDSPVRGKSGFLRSQTTNIAPAAFSAVSQTQCNGTDTVELAWAIIEQNSVGIQFDQEEKDQAIAQIDAKFHRDTTQSSYESQYSTPRVLRPQTVIAKNPSSFYGLRGDVFYAGSCFTAASTIPYNHMQPVIREEDDIVDVLSQDLSPKYKLEIDSITYDQYETK